MNDFKLEERKDNFQKCKHWLNIRFIRSTRNKREIQSVIKKAKVR